MVRSDDEDEEELERVGQTRVPSLQQKSAKYANTHKKMLRQIDC